MFRTPLKPVSQNIQSQRLSSVRTKRRNKKQIKILQYHSKNTSPFSVPGKSEENAKRCNLIPEHSFSKVLYVVPLFDWCRLLIKRLLSWVHNRNLMDTLKYNVAYGNSILSITLHDQKQTFLLILAKKGCRSKEVALIQKQQVARSL